MTLTQEDLKAIEALFVGKFDSIDKKFDSIDKKFDSIDKKITAMDKRQERLEDTVNQINLRLEHVESDVASLKVGQLQLREELKRVSDKVDATYELALDNWGQIEESKVRIALLEG